MKICDGDKVRMGYVIAFARILPDVLQCYKCHRFGHTSYTCKAAFDGRELCRRCGAEGHSVTVCVRERLYGRETNT